MQRQNPSSRGRDEQNPGEVPNQQRGTLDPEQVRKGLGGRSRPDMKAAHPRPLSDESADEAEDVRSENMSLESQDSPLSVGDQNLACDSNAGPLVDKKPANPYSPPESDEDAPPLPEESSDDEIQVKMPPPKPALPEALRTKDSSASSQAKVKVEYIEQFPPEGAEMKPDEHNQAIKDIGKDTFEKKVEEPMKLEEQPDQGLKEKDDGPNKDKKEQKPEKATEKPEGADEKVKEEDSKQEQGKEPKAENIDNKQGDEPKVAGQGKKERKDANKSKKQRSGQKCKPKKVKKDEEKEKKRGLKSGHKRSHKQKSQEAPDGSGDKAGTEPSSSKRPKEGE